MNAVSTVAPVRGRFVETSIFRRIAGAVDFARTLRRSVAIIGAPGLGKTMALERLAQDHDTARLVVVSNAHRSVKSALEAVVDAFGFYSSVKYAADFHSVIRNQLPHQARLGCFLMIDEAQRLDLNAQLEFASWTEQFGLPVIFCGNADLLKRTRTDDAAFKQIVSRVGKVLPLTPPEPADFVQFAVDYDVYGKDAREAVVNFGSQRSIRELVTLLDAAKVFADRGPIKLETLHAALRYIHDDDAALKLLKQPEPVRKSTLT